MKTLLITLITLILLTVTTTAQADAANAYKVYTLEVKQSKADYNNSMITAKEIYTATVTDSLKANSLYSNTYKEEKSKALNTYNNAVDLATKLHNENIEKAMFKATR